MAQILKRAEVLPDGMFALRAHPLSWCDSKSLTADTNEYHNVPTGAQYVIFSGTTDFYVRFNATQSATAAATVPGDVSDGTACVLNPTQRYLGTEVLELALIAPANCVVTMEFFK